MSETAKLPIRYGAVPRTSDDPFSDERRAIWIATGVLVPDHPDVHRSTQDVPQGAQHRTSYYCTALT